MDLQIIKLGDTAQKVTSTLLIDEALETPANLTGASVFFNYRHVGSTDAISRAATIVSAPLGQVSYQWTEDDAETLGDYVADWRVVFSDTRVKHFPNGSYEYFRVIAPVADGLPFTPIESFREWVRSYLGDDQPLIYRYETDQIDRSIRLAVQMLRVRGQITDLALSLDGSAVTPAVSFDDPVYGKAWALIILHAAKQFVSGSAAATSFRTRALSETFSGNRERVWDLLSEVYELENGEGAL